MIQTQVILFPSGSIEVRRVKIDDNDGLEVSFSTQELEVYWNSRMEHDMSIGEVERTLNAGDYLIELRNQGIKSAQIRFNNPRPR